jgi:hypothetical protein
MLSANQPPVKFIINSVNDLLVVRQVHFDRLLGWQLYCLPWVRQYNCRTNEPVILRLVDHYDARRRRQV